MLRVQKYSGRVTGLLFVARRAATRFNEPAPVCLRHFHRWFSVGTLIRYLCFHGCFCIVKQGVRNRHRLLGRNFAVTHGYNHSGYQRKLFFAVHQFTNPSKSSSSIAVSLAARPGLRLARNSSIGSAGLFLSSPVGLTLARLCGVSPRRSRQATMFFSAVSAIFNHRLGFSWSCGWPLL